MSHKAIIQFEGIKNANTENRSAWVATIWKLLEISGFPNVQEMHDNNELKGFVWNVTEEQGKYTMEFSSIRAELVEAVIDGAKKIIEKGTALPLADDVIIKPTNVFAVEDFRIPEGKIRLTPVSGVIVNKAFRAKGKLHHEGINPYEDNQNFIRIIKKNLLAKVRKFTDAKISDDDVSLRIISSGRAVNMPFRGIPLTGHMCSIQVTGPKQVLETALYAGLGRMNGLGFGLMTPMKKTA